ncbi:30S ribosomal protein S8 [Candidatus Peregrinibacteria bacterium RIFOXYB2_FULL_41_88]|nr:MAG: 30S ribosomal protein S8 [Candidatus Peregrinibacteria bacterium RIFOXYB2_FULL_41_88]
MNTDPIADLLTRIRNASKVQKEIITVPYSNLKNEILKVMQKRGFVANIKMHTNEHEKELEVTLPKREEPINLKRISKPGQRIYIKGSNVPRVLHGLGIAIISTSKGVIDDSEARRQKLGGELLCEIY